jgi:hypothetical protein
MRKQDWRGAGLICLPYVALLMLGVACVLVAWFGIHV